MDFTSRAMDDAPFPPPESVPTTIETEEKGLRPVRYRILIEQDEDGVFVAECPSLPGRISQGKTRREFLANIQDAIKGHLKSLEKDNEPKPPSVEEEIVEVSI